MAGKYAKPGEPQCEARFYGRTRCERVLGHPLNAKERHETTLFAWTDAQCAPEPVPGHVTQPLEETLTLEDLGYPSVDPDPERDFAEEAFNAQLLREE